MTELAFHLFHNFFLDNKNKEVDHAVGGKSKKGRKNKRKGKRRGGPKKPKKGRRPSFRAAGRVSHKSHRASKRN
uniref:Uncharacterized protein n=1 Tax=Panagrolaimus sp. PS1159 TaxID=55785 RepID=A0AC35GMH3_9BILA